MWFLFHHRLWNWHLHWPLISFSFFVQMCDTLNTMDLYYGISKTSYNFGFVLEKCGFLEPFHCVHGVVTLVWILWNFRLKGHWYAQHRHLDQVWVCKICISKSGNLTGIVCNFAINFRMSCNGEKSSALCRHLRGAYTHNPPLSYYHRNPTQPCSTISSLPFALCVCW